MFALLLHVTVTREKYEQREEEEDDVDLCGFPSMRERPECVELCGERGTHGHEWVDAEPHYYYFFFFFLCFTKKPELFLKCYC